MNDWLGGEFQEVAAALIRSFLSLDMFPFNNVLKANKMQFCRSTIILTAGLLRWPVASISSQQYCLDMMQYHSTGSPFPLSEDRETCFKCGVNYFFQTNQNSHRGMTGQKVIPEHMVCVSNQIFSTRLHSDILQNPGVLCETQCNQE